MKPPQLLNRSRNVSVVSAFRLLTIWGFATVCKSLPTFSAMLMLQGWFRVSHRRRVVRKRSPSCLSTSPSECHPQRRWQRPSLTPNHAEDVVSPVTVLMSPRSIISFLLSILLMDQSRSRYLECVVVDGARTIVAAAEAAPSIRQGMWHAEIDACLASVERC